MKRFSIYWEVITNNGDEVNKCTKSCDVIASDFSKAVHWLVANQKDFNMESITSVYSYDNVHIAE